MKKNIISICLFLSILGLITGCGCNKKDKDDKDKNKENLSEIEQQVENGTEEFQGDFQVKNLKITEVGAESVITGTVINNSDLEKSIMITLLMSNSESGQLLGIANVEATELKSKESRDFSLSIIGDYTLVDNFEVRISEM